MSDNERQTRIVLKGDSSQLNRALADGENAADRFEGGITRAKNSLSSFTGVLAGVSAAFVTKELLDAGLASERLSNSLLAATGSFNQSRVEMNYIISEADRLGLNLQTLGQDYVKLTASSHGTVLEGQATRDIFTAVAEASTALTLSAGETSGAILAVSQMISKGKVSAEELRQQLGERLPGAYQAAERAVRAIGFTEPLDELLQKGKIVAADFLPRFAAELRQTYSGQLTAAIHSTQAEINRFNNELFRTKAALADAVLPAFTEGLRVARPFLGVMQELGEPAMYTAIALGVGRMSTAMVGLATSTTAAVTAGRLLQSTLPGLAAMAGFTLAKAYADSRNLESEGKEIKSLVTYGHEGARMRYMGTTPQNLDALEDVKIMHYIKDKLPGYTAEQYAAFIREGGIQFKKVTDSAFNEWWYKVQVNDSAVKRALDGMQSRPVAEPSAYPSSFDNAGKAKRPDWATSPTSRTFFSEAWDRAADELAFEDAQSFVLRLNDLGEGLRIGPGGPLSLLGGSVDLMATPSIDPNLEKRTQMEQETANSILAIQMGLQEERYRLMGDETAALDVQFAYKQQLLDMEYQAKIMQAQQLGLDVAAIQQEYAWQQVQLEEQKAQALADIWWNSAQTYINFAQQMTTMGVQMLLFEEGQKDQIGKRMLATSVRFIAQGLQQYMFGKAKEHVLNAAGAAGKIQTDAVAATANLGILEAQATAWAAFFSAMSLNPYGGQAFIPAATAMAGVAGGVVPSAMAAVATTGATSIATELALAAAWGLGGIAVGALGEGGASAIEGGTAGSTTPAGYGAGTPGSPVVTQPVSTPQPVQEVTVILNVGTMLGDRQMFQRWFEDVGAAEIRDAVGRNVDFGLQPRS
ncbi:tape measure protein [Geobacter anodireducens]|uniref:Tape measure protein n=1 Tax=Geobacter anodireducens TaxID=1340425 RepID=A0ABR9NSJ1_9BACT|nr:tape measure protein [Geobacter anodireducens]MBE2887233.1 tape measure protein [Geobacter anodireducens]